MSNPYSSAGLGPSAGLHVVLCHSVRRCSSYTTAFTRSPKDLPAMIVAMLGQPQGSCSTGLPSQQSPLLPVLCPELHRQPLSPRGHAALLQTPGLLLSPQEKAVVCNEGGFGREHRGVGAVLGLLCLAALTAVSGSSRPGTQPRSSSARHTGLVSLLVGKEGKWHQVTLHSRRKKCTPLIKAGRMEFNHGSGVCGAEFIFHQCLLQAARNTVCVCNPLQLGGSLQRDGPGGAGQPPALNSLSEAGKRTGSPKQSRGAACGCVM